MRTLLIAFILLCMGGLPVTVSAQVRLFADILWETPRDSVRQALRKRGYIFSRMDLDGDDWFKGTLAGHDVTVLALYANGKLGKFVIGFSPPDHRVREVYAEMRNALIQKYGEPTKTFQFFHAPYYEGDGFEDTAIRTGKAVYASFWAGSETGKLSLPRRVGHIVLHIQDNMTISLAYEGDVWKAESLRRAAKANKDL